MAKTRTSDQKKSIRQKQLQDFCRRKGWALPEGKWDLQKAYAFFGGEKSTTKIRDLLTGNGSFGPQIARDLENASRGELSPLSLDGAEVAPTRIADWPFSKLLGEAVKNLDAEGVFRAENLLRSHLGIDPLPREALGELPASQDRQKAVNE